MGIPLIDVGDDHLEILNIRSSELDASSVQMPVSVHEHLAYGS